MIKQRRRTPKVHSKLQVENKVTTSLQKKKMTNKQKYTKHNIENLSLYGATKPQQKLRVVTYPSAGYADAALY